MNTWWENLTGLQQFFYYIAIPSTLILIIQTILSLLGIGGDSDADMDLELDSETNFDMDVDTDGDVSADFRFVSFRGIIAFLTIFGWVGATLTDSDYHTFFIILISSLSGLLAMFVIGYLFYGISKLQSSGNININNALGLSGEVYIPIPANRKGTGKIQITIQERLIEVEAMTDNNKIIATGTMVKVVDIFNNHILVVEKI